MSKTLLEKNLELPNVLQFLSISLNLSRLAEVVSKELVNFREAPGVRKQFGSARENMGQQCEFRNFIVKDIGRSTNQYLISRYLII